MEEERELYNMFSVEEIAAAATEPQASTTRRGFSFSWGGTRRRSSAPHSHRPPPTADEASSPATTPLSFCPSESDDKDNTLKMKREHYLKNMEELKKDNHLLAADTRNVNRYNELVKDFNSKLRVRQQKVRDGPYQRKRDRLAQEEARCGEKTTSLGVASSSGSGGGSALSTGNRNNNNVGPSPTGLQDMNLQYEGEAEE